LAAYLSRLRYPAFELCANGTNVLISCSVICPSNVISHARYCRAPYGNNGAFYYTKLEYFW